ncbi:hypothetical protein CPC08DRAFT_773346 [Agrocybe pediades]|nr:hypothetical protein CPC08DRAFT_731269 [Agrocybe pediades]KAF9558168.1 hypothetical protein CPC08DRAFT_773346 [Agrocybe pediades]
MAENICPPLSQTVSMTAIQRAERGTSLRERNACNASIEDRIPRNMDCVIDVHTANPLQPVAQLAQSPVVNVVDPALTSHESSNVKILLRLWTWVCTKGMRMLSTGFFPASKWCCYLFNCTPNEGVTEQTRQEYLARWETSLTSIARSWKDTQSITTYLLLTSGLAILQLNDAPSNRAICTCISVAILFALASILSSFVYLLSKQRFISRWKTSEALDMSFWRCVGMPLDFAMWSFVFFVSTVFILIYKRMLPADGDATNIVQCTNINPPKRLEAAIITVLSVISACKVGPTSSNSILNYVFWI